MEIQNAIKKLGIEVSFQHTPSDYDGLASKLRFIGTVTVERNGRRQLVGGFPYFMGIGHVPAFKNRTNPRPSFINMESAPKIERELKTGKTYKNGKWVDIIPEDCAGFLHCLILDGIADDMSFEDWCFEFDLDTDSRKALAMYEDCRSTGMLLRTGFPRETLDSLKELLADY